MVPKDINKDFKLDFKNYLSKSPFKSRWNWSNKLRHWHKETKKKRFRDFIWKNVEINKFVLKIFP